MAAPTGTFIVTGSNAGLGLALAAKYLASPNATTGKALFGARNPAGATELRSLVDGAASSGPRHEVVQLDLSDLASVRASAKRINDRVKTGEIKPIRALVLNAAMQQTKGQTFTDDGLEQHFAINYLANFLLILLLLPSMDRQDGRIVMVSSWTHDPPLEINNLFITEESHKTFIKDDIEELAKPKQADKKGDEWKAGMRRYGGSKTLLITFM